MTLEIDRGEGEHGQPECGKRVPDRCAAWLRVDLRGGKVTRFAWLNNPAEALEAVGREG
jgi:hypothetical protein